LFRDTTAVLSGRARGAACPRVGTLRATVIRATSRRDDRVHLADPDGPARHHPGKQIDAGEFGHLHVQPPALHTPTWVTGQVREQPTPSVSRWQLPIVCCVVVWPVQTSFEQTPVEMQLRTWVVDSAQSLL